MGAVCKRGTDFGTHMLTSFSESRTNDNDSIGICFVDLVKAFDRVLRKLVMGWPRLMTSHPIEYLRKVGVGSDDATWIVNWITKRRPLFEEWVVHTKIAALVKNLHDGCWLAYDDLSTVMLCASVRQGCESGPMIFNSIYHLATEAVKDNLRDEGMSLPASLGELWDHDTAVVTARARSLQGQSVVHHNIEEILDVYFVDDGCYMVAHKHAAELVKRVRLLVATIVSIFSRFQLSVKMVKGKTEVMLTLSGKNATAEREKLRGADGLWLDIDDDERQAHCKVHVVSEYKHLGTWVSLRLKCMRDAKHKEDPAMASYSPLAVKVFGNRRIRTWLNMALMRSLVIVLQFVHLGSSTLAFETLEQCAHARLETHNWMHQWGPHGRCWSTSSFE